MEMALSAPSTPKNNLNTSRKVRQQMLAVSTSKVYKSVTPKCKKIADNEQVTPMHNDGTQHNYPSQTPKCFNNVSIETPLNKNRVSKEKCDELTNLTVAVRVRPMNVRELAYVGASDIVRVSGNELSIRACSNLSVSTDHIFQYDHVFWSCDESNEKYSNQEDVFLSIGEPLLQKAFKGYNACLFAYGQTGSGKSYSMMGADMDLLNEDDENVGITPRFCKLLFKKLDELQQTNNTASIELSYFEIYNEKIHDLLAVNVNSSKTALRVREHPVWGPYVVDLSVHTVKSYSEMKEWLKLGNKNRVTAATLMNEKSSRSHSIFSIELDLCETLGADDSSKRSKVSLVDLAGSERLGNTYNNEEKIRQGVSINKSLLTLGKVISALSEHKKSSFVPYRDSVLTWLLRESLGGNSLTSMLATISPANSHIDETLATLRYACQARSIVNRARVNENPHDRLIRELRAEVERLRALRQDYEKHTSRSSIICIDDSTEQPEEMESLKQRLSETEDKLLKAETNWERRFVESKLRQEEQLAKVEQKKDELESHIRVMSFKDTDVKLSPYKTNFLEELKGVLEDDSEKVVEKRLTKTEVTASMNQIYEIMSTLRPTVDEVEENVKLLFARTNKLLQAFESALMSSLNKSTPQKVVTFEV